MSPGTESGPAPILAAYQKWLVKESEIGRTSSSKGQISLVATTSIRQFIPYWSLYLFHIKATLASVPNAAVLIQLSLLVISEKLSYSLESGPWMALSERPTSRVYCNCPDITPRKSPGYIGIIGYGAITVLEVGALLSFHFPFSGPL
jgi:hypothetical protein